jgi:hypothetical protein
MQVIAAAPPVSFSARVAVARSAVVATLLVVAGASLAWLFVATPIVGGLMPSGQATTSQAVVEILAWVVAIVVPAGLLLIGVTRIAETVEAAAALKPRALTPALRAALGPDQLAATDLRLPGGRRVHELVLGPYGIVVIGEVPPPAISRAMGTRWEVRDERGRWIPVESPTDRATRDAERVRSWLGSDDRDFVVRVYAAVISDDRRVPRTGACAVVSPDDLAAWLGGLPPQRGLSVERRERLAELVRSAAGRPTAR